MTTSSIDLPPLPFFDPYPDPSSIGQCWKLWKRCFETYITALGISNPTRKRALLLYRSGPATQDIFDTLPDTGDAANYTLAMQKLDAYFTPLQTVDFEIFSFCKESQRSDETVDQYITRLRKLASTCDFAYVDKEIKSVLIQNCSSKRLCCYAFIKVDVTLSQLLAKARAFESSKIHAAGMETSLQTSQISDNQAQAITFKPRSAPHHKQLSQSHPPTTRSPQNRCNHCGGSWPHHSHPYPTKGKSCNACGKANHFALVCRSSKRSFSRPPPSPRQAVKQVSADAMPSTNVCSTTCAEEEYLSTVQVKAANKTPIVTVKLNDTPISMTVDTGASLDIIDEPTFDRLKHRVSLQRSTTRIFVYGASTQLPILKNLLLPVRAIRPFTQLLFMSLKDSTVVSSVTILQRHLA